MAITSDSVVTALARNNAHLLHSATFTVMSSKEEVE